MIGSLIALLVAILAFVSGTTMSADGHTTAVSAMVSGVWWKGQIKGIPPGPPPPQVPANGLWVSSTAAGTTAMSALRFTIAPGDRQPILTLPVEMLTSASQSNLAALPVDFSPNIRACATTGDWSPPAAGTFGALSEAPAYDCSKGQTLAQVSDKTVVFDLSSFVSEAKRVVSIVVIPGTSPVPIPSPPVALPIPALPPVLLQTTFDITFKPVTIAAVEVLPGQAVTEDDDAFDDTSADDAFYSVIDSNSGFALGNPSTPTVPPRRGLSVLPRQVARQVGAIATESQRTERAVAAGVFVLLCLWAWAVANRSIVPGAAGPGRPFRTLYDGDLSAAGAPAKSRFSTSLRAGKPPSLR